MLQAQSVAEFMCGYGQQIKACGRTKKNASRSMTPSLVLKINTEVLQFSTCISGCPVLIVVKVRVPSDAQPGTEGVSQRASGSVKGIQVSVFFST